MTFPTILWPDSCAVGRRVRRALLLGLAALVSQGCNLGLGPATTPTQSAEQVLATAQAIAEQTRNAAPPTPTVPAATSTPTEVLETPTPQATATSASPVVIANYNANVRQGPGELYPVIDFFLAGETAAAVGRYDDPLSGRWWLIRRLGQGLDGWVWGGAVTFSGSEAGVPILEAPATPTETPPGPPP